MLFNFQPYEGLGVSSYTPDTVQCRFNKESGIVNHPLTKVEGDFRAYALV